MKKETNMRKGLAVLLILTLVLASGLSAYASGLTDITGTACETAVSALITNEIVSGYEEDNTYRPNNPISRAEACVIVVRAMGAAKSEIATAPSSGYTDLDGYGWAEEHINYATAKGVISGYGNGIFRPAGNVTYVEMAAMLINAQGITADDLEGSWPDNYVNEASRQGLFAGIVAGTDWNYGNTATRGNVAVMTYDTIDKSSWSIPARETNPASPASTSNQNQSTSGGEITLTPYERLLKAEEAYGSMESEAINFMISASLMFEGEEFMRYTENGQSIILAESETDVKVLMDTTTTVNFLGEQETEYIALYYLDDYYYINIEDDAYDMKVKMKVPLDRMFDEDTKDIGFEFEENAIKSQSASGNTLTFIIDGSHITEAVAGYLDSLVSKDYIQRYGDVNYTVLLNEDGTFNKENMTFSVDVLIFDEIITTNVAITLSYQNVNGISIPFPNNLNDYIEVDPREYGY